MPRIIIQVLKEDGTILANSEAQTFERAEEELGTLERYLNNNRHEYETK